MNKTGRIRGVIFRIIRTVAKRRKTFTLRHLNVPNPTQNCLALVKLGELTYVWRGEVGHHTPTVYTRTPKLRAAARTNAHKPKVSPEDVP